VNLGGGIGVALGILGLLTALAASATFIALGTQRGRVQRLEDANEGLRNRATDLREEMEDRERRYQRSRQEMADQITELTDRSTRQQSINDHLKGEIETLSLLPLQKLADSQAATQEMLAGHHKEAMFGQELAYSLLLDLMHMEGDKRHHRTIEQAMREQAPPRELGQRDQGDG